MGLIFLVGFQMTHAQGPGCPSIDVGSDQNLDCSTNCTDLNATLLNTGETSTYEVSSIPYAPPAPFTGGTQLFVNIDDTWSEVIDLPFNFCFYGNMYSQIVVGTNGLITFDATLANDYCEWQFSDQVPSPNLPGNSIMGAYHDIDPSYGGNINYSILGSSPCRTFVVNFSDVPHFDCDCSFLNSCKKTTQQIVIYETTNVIEVYVEQKETCNGWNSGNAVIGIQDATGTGGITPPGRNTGPWSTANEAWRFTPNGSPSYTVNWYDDSNNLVGTGVTLNVCPTNTTTYTGEAVYQHCDGSQVVVSDQVTINITGGFTTSLNTNPESCGGNCDGTATITASGGTPPYSFDIGNGPQANGDFTGLCAGTYTVDVSDNGGCSGTINVVINNGGSIVVDEAFTNETCMGLDNGTITLTASGGTAPYGYDIGYGNPNATGVFTNLPPGNYNYTVLDASQCPTTGVIVIEAGANCCNMTNTVNSANPLCAGVCDGTITLTESDGAAPVQYSIDDGNTFQANGNFAGVCAGTYDVLVEDVNGCQYMDQVVLIDPPSVSASASSTVSSCGACDGTITVTASGGDGGPYQYSIDNGVTFQASDSFSAVCPDNYDVVVQDASGCQATTTVTVDVADGPLIVDIAVSKTTCNGVCDGTIDITAVSATQYSVDNGGTWQSSGSFTGLCVGNYDIVIEDATGCQVTDIAVINEPTPVTLEITSINPGCFGGCDGVVIATADGGTPPYAYSIDNGSNFQASASFAGLCDGDYDIIAMDANLCTVDEATTLTEPTALQLELATTEPTCNGYCDGNIEANVSGATAPYNYMWSTGETGEQAQDLCDGTYGVTVTDANGCFLDSVDIPIIEPEPMVVDNVIVTHEICYADCEGSINIEAAGASLYSIDGGVTFSNSSLFYPLCAGEYDIAVQSDAGCAATSFAEILRPIQVKAGFYSIPEITTEIEPMIDFFNTSTGATNYQWYFGDGYASTDTNPGYDYNNGVPGIYEVCLVALNDEGCTDTICQTVIINEVFTIYVPNAFTPNEDVLNNVFMPVVDGEMSGTYQFRIFNRWGEEIFFTKDKDQGWDGTVDTQPVQEDIYLWRVIVAPASGGDDQVYMGRVALFR